MLKDDLVKSGPYKRDRAGMPQEDSIIKLHAVIFKHAQKRIINKELDYQEKRIKMLKDKDFAGYSEIVRRAELEYRKIEKYVTEQALYLMKLEYEL